MNYVGIIRLTNCELSITPSDDYHPSVFRSHSCTHPFSLLLYSDFCPLLLIEMKRKGKQVVLLRSFQVPHPFPTFVCQFIWGQNYICVPSRVFAQRRFAVWNL